jgi:hypothetical protein
MRRATLLKADATSRAWLASLSLFLTIHCMFFVNCRTLRTLHGFAAQGRADRYTDRHAYGKPYGYVSSHHSEDRTQRRSQRDA